jgi:hypothetical protein
MINQFLHLTDQINLLDIGCSGGFDQTYLNLPSGKRNLIGIDMSYKEIQKLKSDFPDSKFYNYEIVSPELNFRNSHSESNYPLHRTLAYLQTSKYSQIFTNEILLNSSDKKLLRHIEMIGKNMKRFDESKPPIDASLSNFHNKNKNHFYSFHQSRMSVYSDKTKIPTITLDEFANQHEIQNIDFLKIDTDGTELNVLKGGENLLSNILGIKIEVQFHGLVSTNDSIFNSIDAFLQKKSFSLVDLQIIKYDRFSLPGYFTYPEIPANTNFGPIMWADAYYIKTKNHPSFFKDYGTSRSIKLIYWLSNLNLYALAAEILIENRQYFNTHDLLEIYRILLDLNLKIYSEK